MSDFFIGEIRMFGFNWAPKYWALCNGAVMQISQNQALFALLGFSYGGDNKTNFNLPDLRGRVPLAQGIKGAFSYKVGAAGGAETVTLTNATMPAHNHTIQATTALGNKTAIINNYFATTNPAVATDTALHPIYGAPTNSLTPLNNAIIGVTGGNAAHENRQPYTVVNFCIATVGLYPARN